MKYAIKKGEMGGGKINVNLMKSSDKARLIRRVDDRERYYDVSLSLNLFGEFIVEKIYGAVRNKKPTGSKRSFFDNKLDADRNFENTLKSKLGKGYVYRVLI